MLIKVDEDLPLAVVEMLAAAGHDALSVRDQDMGGWKDPALWVAVQDENRFLVTADKGFGDIRRYPPGGHAGILLLRPDEDGIEPVIALLRAVLASRPLDSLACCLAVATPRSLRVRRALVHLNDSAGD